MLSVKSIGAGSAGKNAADYYERLAAEDYYSAGGEPPGRYIGGQSASLALIGMVQQGDLGELFAGYHPRTGESLSNNSGDHHKPGYDLCFSAPKSVSVLWSAVGEGERREIAVAQQRAVERAIAYAEQSGAFVQRSGHAGKIRTSFKEGVVAATFEHSTSRNLDPQLHTHAIVLNISQNGKRIDFDTSFTKEIGAAYRVELAHELRSLGYSIDYDRFSFKISGVSKDLERDLSTRRREIEKALSERGLNSAAASEVAALGSRQKKQIIDRNELFKNAREIAQEHGFEIEKCRGVTELSWKQENFLRLAFDQNSTLSATQLRAKLLESCQGICDSREALEKLGIALAAGDLLRLKTDDQKIRYTSREMREIEKEMANRAVAMKSKLTHAVREASILEASRKRTLTQEQETALRHVTGAGQISMIQGIAGSGKSYMLGTARESWEAEGYRVQGAALSGKAAQGLQEGSGIESQTLHGLFLDIEHGKKTLTNRDVLVVDEAGMVGSRMTCQLLKYAQDAGAKVVLVGDSRQLQAIDAGGAFRALQKHVGCEYIDQIFRQREAWMQQATHDFADGMSKKALLAYAKAEMVHIQTTKNESIHRIAEDYLANTSMNKDKLILATTRADVRLINAMVRKLRDMSDGFDFKSEKEDKIQFAEDDRILFTKNDKQLKVKNGTLGTILQIEKANDRTKLVVLTDEGRKISFCNTDYAHVQHGYAVTTHKAQGVSVECTYALAGGTMQNREMSYVMFSRHKTDCNIYFSQKDCETKVLREAQATERMLEYAQQIAIKKGIEAPTAVDFLTVREWLNTNSSQKLEIRDIEQISGLSQEEVMAIEAEAVRWGISRQKDTSLDYHVIGQEKEQFQKHDELLERIKQLRESRRQMLEVEQHQETIEPEQKQKFDDLLEQVSKLKNRPWVLEQEAERCQEITNRQEQQLGRPGHEQQEKQLDIDLML